MKTYVIGLLLLLIGFAPIKMSAQEPTEEPTVFSTTQAWRIIDLNADEGDESEESYAVFLWAEDGETLIQVVSGADILYTRSEDGMYSGAPLVPTDAYDYEAVLEIIDEDTLETTSELRTTVFTSENNFRYERTAIDYGVWVEEERNLLEYSMFAECLGLMDVQPGRVWVTPDPLLPIGLDEDEGSLYVGQTALTGGSGLYERVEESEFGQFTQVITQTAVVSEDRIDFTYHAIAAERDDCEVRYETSFIPFDEDYDALLERAVELSEED